MSNLGSEPIVEVIDESKLKKSEIKQLERLRAEAKELADFRQSLEDQTDVKDKHKIESLKNKRKFDYYILKVKMYQIYRDLPNSRRFLYKLDLHIKDKLKDDFKLRSEFLILQS